MADFEVISHTTLASNQTSIDFTSIPQTYKHLNLQFSVRGTSANGACPVLARLNNNAASVYGNAHFLFSPAFGSTYIYAYTATNTYFNAQSPYVFPDSAGGESTKFGFGQFSFLDYTNTSQITIVNYSGGGSDYSVRNFQATGIYQNNSAIDRITLTTSSQFASGSSFTLWGSK